MSVSPGADIPLAPLVLVANTRLPSERAQALQVSHAAAAFARAGVPTTVLHARRRRVMPLPAGDDLWSYYAVAPGGDHPRPAVEDVACSDWIESVPRWLQYLPARLQEVSFARNAARRARALARRRGESSLPLRLYSREIEAARMISPRHRIDVFLEIHRVPAGRLRRSWLLEAAERAAGVLAISGGVRDDLLTLGVAPDLLRVEHDAFEPTLVSAAPDRNTARRELRLAEGEQVVVYTGGLLAWKGVEIAAEAARLLPGVTFLVAGGMEQDVTRLRRSTSDIPNLRVDGFQPPERVPLYLAAADLGLVPNLAEPVISALYTSPLKVFESMAAGLPLVASDLPSLREILDETQARFFPPGDARALATALRELLADEPARRAMAGAMASAAPAHTWDRRAERILTWMEEASCVSSS
jgi:glycosyltransferase involved in cell wall biosynthesis